MTLPISVFINPLLCPPVCMLVDIGSQRKFEVVVDSLKGLLVAGSKHLVVVGDAECQHQNCSSCQAAEALIQVDALEFDLQKLKK